MYGNAPRKAATKRTFHFMDDPGGVVDLAVLANGQGDLEPEQLVEHETSPGGGDLRQHLREVDGGEGGVSLDETEPVEHRRRQAHRGSAGSACKALCIDTRQLTWARVQRRWDGSGPPCR